MALSFVHLPSATTPLLETFTARLLAELQSRGHICGSSPDNSTDAVFSTARFGEVVGWRQAPLFCLRSRFKLERSPMIFTLVHVTKAELSAVLARLDRAVASSRPDPSDLEFAGLLPSAYRILHEQGKRGGSMLALIRVLQVQTKSLRIVLVVGDESPTGAYHFDLVGSHPLTAMTDEAEFFNEIGKRIITAVSTHEVTSHLVSPSAILSPLWSSLNTPRAMCEAALEFGSRGLLTRMVKIADLTRVPSVSDALAAQYSEGCYSTWEPRLAAMITTASGSSKAADKNRISSKDLVVVTGLRADGLGAIVQPVEGRSSCSPSSETVEMLLIDAELPTQEMRLPDGSSCDVPVVRSKLHIHRGVRSFDPRFVEYVPLPARSQKYLVSCATQAQAVAVAEAFSNSSALRNPADDRDLVFTVLPGHGIMVVEKWARGKRPFQLIWEHIDARRLEIESSLPQGPHDYVPARSDQMQLATS